MTVDQGVIQYLPLHESKIDFYWLCIFSYIHAGAATEFTLWCHVVGFMMSLAGPWSLIIAVKANDETYMIRLIKSS